jgi:hypothetical protein
MHCTDCSHPAARTPSILTVHRLEIDSWGYRSSGGHTWTEIGHIVGWDILLARRCDPIGATLDYVVVSRTSYCGRSRVCCRSQLHLVAGVRPAGFVGERSLLCIHRKLDCRIQYSPAPERERIPYSQKSCLRGRRCLLFVMSQ